MWERGECECECLGCPSPRMPPDGWTVADWQSAGKGGLQAHRPHSSEPGVVWRMTWGPGLHYSRGVDDPNVTAAATCGRVVEGRKEGRLGRRPLAQTLLEDGCCMGKTL